MTGADRPERRQEPYEVVDLINGKRRGARLTDAEVDWVIDAYTRGVVADEQMSALAMAIAFVGLEPDELQRWTDAMTSVSPVERSARSRSRGSAAGTSIPALPASSLTASMNGRPLASVRKRIASPCAPQPKQW